MRLKNDIALYRLCFTRMYTKFNRFKFKNKYDKKNIIIKLYNNKISNYKHIILTNEYHTHIIHNIFQVL